MDTTRLLFTILLCTAGLAGADEFQANVRTAGNQCHPVIAVDADGRSVLVWSSYFSSGGRSNDIVGRCFDPNGSPAGDEFQLNATGAGNQTEPAVAIDGDGFLFAAWQGPGVDGDEDIFARVFDPNGQPLTDESAVNIDPAGRQLYPSVAASESGTFIVVWERRRVDEIGEISSIYGQRFDANGMPMGDERLIDDGVWDCRYPDVAMDRAGNFAVVWMQDRTSNTVRACLFDANGWATTEPFDVSRADIASVTRPSIAMRATGDFVVVWDGDPNLASLDDIHARCFEPNGTPQSEPFLINSRREGAQQWPQVAMGETNEFAVVWQHEHQDPNIASDIFARRFHLDGRPIGEEVKLNGYVAGRQRYPEAAMANDGSLIAAWESDDQDGSGYGIFARIEPPPPTADLNADGTVDFRDFRRLGGSWLASGENEAGDLTADGLVNSRDLEILCQHWLD